jgi:beta-N-acetylhexosaminidase
VPFRAAIGAGAALVMTAHIALPAIQGDNTPATLSQRVITGLLRDSLRFSGATITDAMTMEGIGKGYTVEQSSVAAVKAGDDILLKPSDPTRAINAVVAAVERGEISRGRVDSAARHMLELKARAGLHVSRLVSPTTAREIVGSPEHRALAAAISRRAVTLLRDRQQLLPLTAGAPRLLIQYAPESELKAGRVLAPALRAPAIRSAKIGPGVTKVTLDSLSRLANDGRVVVVAVYVRRVEGEGRFAIPAHIAAWIDTLATRSSTIVLAFGNPYLIRQFPSVGSYLVTYGVSDDLERAAANVVLGRAGVSGKTPVSLPGFFRAGDGLTRSAVP